MSVHTKPDGRWFAVWIDPQTKKQRRKYFGRGPDAERDAREFDTTTPARKYDRRTPEPDSATFAELANAYAESRLGIMEQVSLENWLYKMRGIIFPAIGSLRALDITPAQLDRYVAARLATLKNSKRPELGTIKRTTIHRELSDIRAVLNWSARRRYIPFNPSSAYDMPKRDDAIIAPPSAVETSAIIRHAPEHLARALILAYFLGLRPGPRELFSLRWTDADLNSGMMTVRSAKKNGIRARMVPIHSQLSELLCDWQSTDLASGAPRDSTIIHYRGRPVASLKRSFQTAKRHAGIPKSRRLRLYDLRHAFATEALRAHGDLKSVSTILGHTRTDTTTRIYQHIDDAQTRDAIDRLPRLDLPVNSSGQSLPDEKTTIH